MRTIRCPSPLRSTTLAVLLGACGPAAMSTSDMAVRPDIASMTVADMAMGAAADMTGMPEDMAVSPCAPYVENVTACMPGAMDYQPRKGMPASNGWPACVSDKDANQYVLNGMSAPGASARSVALKAMADKLWKNTKAPTMTEFVSARDDYSIANGIASRVARRQDLSYPEVPGGDKFACQMPGIPEMHPDRCAGPGKLKPIIDDAFVKGIAGDKPMVQSARIEAALMWFFHLSLMSEFWTASFDNVLDVDSACGYYTEVTARGAPTGYAKVIADIAPETHNRIYDAMLAARCWRDADTMKPPEKPDLYNRAQAQIDKSARRGIAMILRERIGRVGCTTGEAQMAAIEFVKILGGLLDHNAQPIDATNAAKLKAYTSNPTTDTPAILGAKDALDKLFPCP